MSHNSDKYSVSKDEDFDQNSEVLRNRLGIVSKTEMEILEESELQRTESELFKIFDEDHRFTSKDIRNIHELWLGDIYYFAGKYRTFNLSKAGFSFAASQRIVYCMQNFESKILS